MLRKLYCTAGNNLFMTSSGDHLLPQVTKAIERYWQKTLENSIHRKTCHWMDQVTYEVIYFNSNFLVSVIYSHYNLFLSSVIVDAQLIPVCVLSSF